MRGSEEAIRKERAGLPFEEKIRILVEMRRLARSFGQKEGVFVWEIEEETASPSLRSPQAPNSIHEEKE
ncbi:hypothetical protein [Thermoflexus sp.]|uniref:hypothetical protein n=1 Tax=Thermoflexus sp. TaxID=1969742 RepID=UPI002ADE7830|nr:hypothetical protein [Thermoflexus sp.]